MRFNIQTPSTVRGIPARISRLVTKIENHPWLAWMPKKFIRPALAVITLAILGSVIYFSNARLGTNTATEETQTLQTAVARRGDLVIYASGTGTLTAADEVDLAFKTNGQVEGIYVKVGDTAEKGDLLAEVDDSEAQMQYEEASRALRELISVGAIATAQEAMAAAQTDLVSAINHLEYLISPDVLYWESEVEQAKQAVEQAKAALEADPTDEELKKQLEETEAYLDFAEDELEGDQYYYEHEYLPNNFTTYNQAGEKYIAAPTDSEIKEGRAAVTVAKATLQEAEYLYAALTGGEVPEDATGSGLTELEQAQLDLESAQATLDGARIYAPFSGTTMAVDTSVGDASGTSTVITLADLSQLYIEIYLDESDWSNIAEGYEAEIIFDVLPEKTFSGQVIQVDPGLYTSGNTSVVRAIVKLDAPLTEINLPIGTSAAVDVIGGKAEDAVLVPVEALHQAGDQYTIFVMEDGQPRLRVVEVGIQDLLYAEIRSGLEAGEIVTTGITETK